MIDVHTHLLPNIDHGSDSLECTEAFIRLERYQGVTDLFVTPHSEDVRLNPEAVRQEYEKLQAYLKKLRLETRVYLGCEIMCCSFFMERILRELEAGILPSLNDSACVLVEFPPFSWVTRAEVEACVRALQEKGWIPVLAHAERCSCLDLEAIRELKEQGCLVQMNLYSLEECAEKELRKRAEAMVNEELVTFVGTDCHNRTLRPPSLEQGLRYLKNKCSRDYLQKILYGNARDWLIAKTAGQDRTRREWDAKKV